MKNICIIGAGSWGTALALTAHRAGQKVTLITRRPEQADALTKYHENKDYLPGISLPVEFTISNDLSLLKQADIVLQVTPTSSFEETCARVQKYLPPHAPWVICAKGIVLRDGEGKPQLLSEVSKDFFANPTVILSGPSFANEVGQNLPTAVTIASEDKNIAKDVASCLRHSRFRCYINDDPKGVQIAGALKNILAIACGIAQSRGFGNNAIAALITRGLAEIRRFGIALGCKGDTFLGLAGVGDVTLTCSNEQSRNMRLGKALGQKGADVRKILAQSSFITEGVPTVAAVYKFAQNLSIPMPLCEAVYSILYKDVPIDSAIENILSRQSELEF